MKLKKSLHGLNNAAKIWIQLLFEMLHQIAFKEMETASYLFIRRGTMSICYVDDLLSFVRDKRIIEERKAECIKRSCLKYLRKPK